MKWTAIIELLNYIAKLFKNAGVRKENKEAQHERDEIEANPGEWFNDRFGGMRNDRSAKETKANTTDD